MKRIVCPDLSTWTETALHLVVRQARRAIAERGRFCLALSGGRTPTPFFRRLAESELDLRIDWSCCQVFWADERCVPPTDGASNFGTAWSQCLSRLPIPTANVHRIAGEMPPSVAADQYERILREHLDETNPLDLVLLGVGKDGHTASLFPGSPSLEETTHWVLPVPVPADPPSRITLTFPILNDSRRVLFLVRGREKREILERITVDSSLPAARIAPPSGDIVWLLDREAAP